MTAPTFKTTEYEWTHGKAPRGKGFWAFLPNTTREWIFSPEMTFAEAKAWAKRQVPDAHTFKVGA